jgi:O-antigen/teichoic acid export membrane protein
MTGIVSNQPNQAAHLLRDQVRSAVLWRSGAQIAGQLIAWASTFLVIRVLDPADYGLFSMTQVVLALLNMLNGYGLASALIRLPTTDEAEFRRAARQLFGMLLLLNGGLALMQLALAPAAAAYFRQPDVASLLRVQAALYLTTPFVAFPYALLARAMDFRRQAAVNLLASLAGAVTALGGALSGWGVWTLVAAPFALFSTRAVGMMIAARAWIAPSFDFRGAGAMARFGGLMAAGQLFWFLQAQADVFIGGRLLNPHTLGLYTTALFLTQIFTSKVVPPLNEIAFSAYAKIQDDRTTSAAAFLKGARVIMAAALPFYLGLAAVVEPLVEVVLGPKWSGVAPVLRLLALAMPFFALQSLFAPASDAAGHPNISMRNAATGAVLLPCAFLIGVQGGVHGLALAWLAAGPPFLLIVAARTLPVLGIAPGALLRAVEPPLLAAAAMAAGAALLDRLLPTVGAVVELVLLVAAGAIIYAAWLAIFARDRVDEIVGLLRR